MGRRLYFDMDALDRLASETRRRALPITIASRTEISTGKGAIVTLTVSGPSAAEDAAWFAIRAVEIGAPLRLVDSTGDATSGAPVHLRFRRWSDRYPLTNAA